MKAWKTSGLIVLLVWLIFAIPVIIGYLIWFIVLKRKQENIN